MSAIDVNFFANLLGSDRFRLTLLSPRGGGWHVWLGGAYGYYVKGGVYTDASGTYTVEDYVQTETGEVRFYIPSLTGAACLQAPGLGLFVGSFSEIHAYLGGKSYSGYHVVFFDTITGHGLGKDISGMILAADPILYTSDRRHLQFSAETIFVSMKSFLGDIAQVERLDGSLETFPGIPRDPGVRGEFEKWLRYAAVMFFTLEIKL